MRKRILLAAAAVAAMSVALMLPTSSAGADGTTVITAGPAQYTLGYTHPTGSVSIGGGTVSARCTAASFVGNSVLGTPRCTTRKVACPLTASFCSLAVNVQENALRGPVAFVAGYTIVGGASGFSTQEAYNCPGANNCGWRTAWAVVAPGSTVQSQVINFLKAGAVSVFSQTTFTVH